ncbi:MAG: hypothetical protein NTZ02_03685 [Candidatus Woesearchaeota archaeon]|nr:hypothetical protein [Candidatus Woesearchaeota archaeon]
MQKNSNGRIVNALAFIIVIIAMALLPAAALAAPSGPQIIFNSTDYGPSGSNTLINTSGGTISTINLYGLTQNPHWKAYVGNVSGKLALQDSSNYSIYDWTVTTVSGEAYASRFNTISWTKIACANATNISLEETALNITASSDDSISKTFSSKTHRSFYVGNVLIANSTCFSTATFVNNASQAMNESMKFQEVLLTDTSSLVYVSLLENKSSGYNTQKFDFQMIVPDYGIQQGSNVPYYLYLELI